MSAEQQEEKERRQKEESIFEFEGIVKELGGQIKEITEEQNILKGKILGLLKELGVKHLKNSLIY